MVKVIVHIAKAVVAIVLSILCLSCGFNLKSVEGDGNVIKKDRTVADAFNSVSVDKDLDVIIIQGAKQSITVETDQNLQEHIKIEVKGNELKITSDANIKADTKRITVVLANIESLSAASSATIKAESLVKSDKISLSSSSDGNIQLNLEVNNLECETSSGGHIEIAGRTEKLETQTSSGGNINAKTLKAKTVKANASSGGLITVNPSDYLSAEASSGAKIFYVTTPAKLKQEASSGGVVSQL
jgi:hypothetical protein